MPGVYSPFSFLHLTIWDAVLVLTVSLQATVIAFLHKPRWKALVYSFPVPFSIANLSLGSQIGLTHVIGLFGILLYANMVRLLHRRLGLNIALSIALSALTYSLLGALINMLIPGSDSLFWPVLLAVIVVSTLLILLMPFRMEPGHRTDLPIHIKFLAVAGVICFLVVVKKFLGGFMTLFPMVGVVAAYETRNSLWALSRQAPVAALGICMMIAAMRVAQNTYGFGIAASLAPGWIAWAVMVALVTFFRWRREGIPARR